MKMRCFIAGAGEYSGSVRPVQDDYIIAADGGYSELVLHGIAPDLVVGDFDSLGSPPKHPNVMQYPAEKDDTDIMIAIKQGFIKGCDTFIIDGGLGGRLDHTYANIQLLAYIAQKGANGYLLGLDTTITAVTNGSIRFLPGAAGRVSVFSIGGKAEGLTLTGLKYPLDDATLTDGYPLGVSNEFTGEPASITVRCGTLIIMWTGGMDKVEGRIGEDDENRRY